MASGNRSPLGFGPILAFHVSLLISGVLLQNIHASYASSWFYLSLGVWLAVLLFGGFWFRRFVWDAFRSYKSAGVLISLLVLSCILGTMLIQDLDLRRAGVFDEGEPRAGQELPPFDDHNKPTRFALAQAHFLQWLSPTEERRKMIEEKVTLSPVERRSLALRRKAFGDRAADAFEEGVLHSKQRQVEQLTTSHYAREHFEALNTFRGWMKRLHLTDIFEAWWFYFLLGLIGVNVIAGTIARAPWSVRDFGLAVTHAGVVIVLMGALTDRLKAKEGYIYFTYGKPDQQVAASIYDQKNRKETWLRDRKGNPFRVYLERFATEYFHELLVERVDWSRRADGSAWRDGEGPSRMGAPFSVRNTFPVRAGVPRLFEDGQVEVIVHDYKPRVFVNTVIGEREGGRPFPAVKLGLYNRPEGGRNWLVQGAAEPWLYAFDPERHSVDLDRYRFEYVWAASEAEYRKLVSTPPLPDNGTLVLRTKSDVERLPVRLGETRRIEIDGREIVVDFLKIQSALMDEEKVNLAQKLQRSEEPLLHLRVNGQGISVPRDDNRFLSRFDILNGVEFRFDWPNPHDHGVFAVFRVVEAEGMPRMLVQLDEQGAARASPIEPGRMVPLIRLRSGHLAVEKAVRSATEKREVRAVSDEEFLREGGGARDELLAAWADVEIRGPWGTVRQELTPYDRSIFYGGERGRPLYVFSLVKMGMARDWFSVLSVLDQAGNRVKTHAVQVNSPLRYAGYRFFQATAGTDREGLGMSGISVTRNPGVIFMYVGYAVLTLGVCWIFFFKPIYDRRRRRKRRAEVAA